MTVSLVASEAHAHSHHHHHRRSTTTGAPDPVLSGLTYTENFDSMGETTTYGTTDWQSYNGAVSLTTVIPGDGNNGAVGIHNFGSTGSSDRALGTLPDENGTSAVTMGAVFTNSTGLDILSIKIAFTEEQWRTTNQNTIDDFATFELKQGVTNISFNNDSIITNSALNLTEILTGSTTTTAVDGNLAANRKAVSGTVTGLSVGNSGTFGIRWNDNEVFGSDAGMAIDDFTMRATLLATNGTNRTATNIAGLSDVVIQNGSATASTLTVNNSTDQTFDGMLQNGGSGALAITKTGSGTLILSGINTYSGGTIVNQGLLELKSASALGSSSGSLTVNGDNVTYGILDLNGQSITVGNLTGTGGKIWNNGPNAGSSAVTLTIGSGNGGGGNYAGLITDNNGAAPLATVALTKAGSGTITLSGANSYTGATNVNGGKLLINGDQTTATGLTTVSNSGSLLGGTGTIGGGVTLASSGTILQAGTGETGQTLTIKGALTQNTTGSILQLALGANGAHSTLALTSTDLSTFYATQQFNFIDHGATTGMYDNILTGVTTAPATTATWQIDNVGWTGVFTYDVTNHAIDLDLIAVPEPSTAAAAALVSALLTCHFFVRRKVAHIR